MAPVLLLSRQQSKKEGKDQKSINQAPYQWESDNITIRHHKREPGGQPFPRLTHFS